MIEGVDHQTLFSGRDGLRRPEVDPVDVIHSILPKAPIQPVKKLHITASHKCFSSPFPASSILLIYLHDLIASMFISKRNLWIYALEETHMELENWFCGGELSFQRSRFHVGLFPDLYHNCASLGWLDPLRHSKHLRKGAARWTLRRSPRDAAHHHPPKRS